MLECPIRCISSRVLAHEAAASVFPVWRRSWKVKPAGRPTRLTVADHRTATPNRGSGNRGYSVLADLTAEGNIIARYLGLLKARHTPRLPAAAPGATAMLRSS